ncbi:putative RING-H2 finger protein ATL21B [Cajanus cajan]|uniref:RING-H2 finger protein ATL1E n=1 Tax=Cajanus cajan TaxID=3821 RepID=A0A151TS57_CAJCA|nr:putative RING-H2 finger protein ATL21B [Cajanus cajan]KYP69882.1 RING-H2 finger protein ATL1E [Cajanus cajan]
MKIPNPILTLFNFILLNPPLTLETCVDTVCHVLIRFPFHTEESCGYPGFQVSCSQNNQTLLNLPNCGQLKIQRINYAAQQLWLNDPNNCLPKRLLSLNLSASPFHAVYHHRFTFFNCSSNLDYLQRRYIAIRCLSHAPTYAVFATPSPTVVVHLSSLCVLVGAVNVPVQLPFYDRVLSSELSDDLRLSWDSPACGRCESHGGRCGFKGNDTVELDCYPLPSQGISRGARYAIAICIGVPALLCSIAVLRCICSWFRVRIRNGPWAYETVADFEALAGSPPATVAGLDRPTIESYPKIVIGENRRLPKKGDKTCSICLSEYMPKETVKTIPECGHCFHAQCIDEWLPLNASCPICRTSPSKLPQPRARSSP